MSLAAQAILLSEQGPVTASVYSLELRANQLEELAGEILATLKINTDNSAINFRNAEARVTFDLLMTAWVRRLQLLAKGEKNAKNN